MVCDRPRLLQKRLCEQYQMSPSKILLAFDLSLKRLGIFIVEIHCSYGSIVTDNVVRYFSEVLLLTY